MHGHHGSPFKLAVSAEMLFLDRPFVERVRRIHERGFGVEIWDWTRKDIAALAATGADFTSMTGYVSGNLTEPEGIAALLASAKESLAVAERLGCPLPEPARHRPRRQGLAGPARRAGHGQDVAGRL